MGYRIAAIAADCKSAPSGSAVRVRLSQQNMNREEHLQKTFPTKEGKTYTQSLDEFNSKKGGDKKTRRSGGKRCVQP